MQLVISPPPADPYLIGRFGEYSVGVGIAVVQLEVNLLHIGRHILVPSGGKKIRKYCI